MSKEVEDVPMLNPMQGFDPLFEALRKNRSVWHRYKAAVALAF
jgi:hypothetical protein